MAYLARHNPFAESAYRHCRGQYMPSDLYYNSHNCHIPGFTQCGLTRQSICVERYRWRGMPLQGDSHRKNHQTDWACLDHCLCLDGSHWGRNTFDSNFWWDEECERNQGRRRDWIQAILPVGLRWSATWDPKPGRMLTWCAQEQTITGSVGENQFI